jgi:hypothetical protein
MPCMFLSMHLYVGTTEVTIFFCYFFAGDCNGDRNCEPQTCDSSRHGSAELNLSTTGPGGLTLTLQQMLEVRYCMNLIVI